MPDTTTAPVNEVDAFLAEADAQEPPAPAATPKPRKARPPADGPTGTLVGKAEDPPRRPRPSGAEVPGGPRPEGAGNLDRFVPGKPQKRVQPERPKPAPKPAYEPPSVSIPYVPDWARSHPAVMAALEKVRTCTTKYFQAVKEHEDAAGAVGLTPGYTPVDLEKAAVNLIATGGDAAVLDGLSGLAKAADRLFKVAKRAAGDLAGVVELVKGEASTAAAANVLPLRAEVAKHWVAMLRAHRQHMEAVRRVQAGGLDPGHSGTFFRAMPTFDRTGHLSGYSAPAAPLDMLAAQSLLNALVADGTLAKADVEGMLFA